MSDISPSRPGTPVENTLRMLATRPDVLDHMAFNGWHFASPYYPNGMKAKPIWDAMSEADKQPWKDRVIDELEEYKTMTPDQIRARQALDRRAILKRNDDAIAARSAEGRNG